MPSDVTSKTAYLQPALTARVKNFCIVKRPGMVIFIIFFHSSPLILNLKDETEATGSPAPYKIAVKRWTNVVFPLVPVTPITLSFAEWFPYTAEAATDSVR